MPLSLSCKCGKRLRVKDELAGKKVKCPGCGDILVPPVEDEDNEPESERVQAVKAGATRQRRPVEHDREEPDEEVDREEEGDSGDEGDAAFWVSGSEILALSDECLYLTSLNDKKLRQAQAALNAGASADDVLAEASTIIPFEHMTKVESNLHHEIVSVTYREPNASEDSDKTIVCKDKEARDQAMAALRARLGSGWKREIIEYTRLKASVGPLVVIAFFSFVTFCFYMAGAHPEDDKSGGKTIRTNIVGAIFVWVFNLFGPIWTAVLGGVFILLGFAWLVARLINPPIMLTLTPKTGGGKKKRR